MKLGKVISKIRKDKNIPIKYLIYNCMNKSTYIRFIEGKTDISASKFIILVKRLNLSLSEFEYINNGYNNYIEQYKLHLQNAYNYSVATSNFAEFRELRYQLLKKCEKSNQFLRNHYFYFYCLVNLTIESIQHKPLKNKYISPIKDYLLSMDTWTYYELSLFNNSIFAFHSKFVNVLLKRIIKNLYKYQNYPNNKNEVIRILENVIGLCIYRKEVNKAIYYYNIAKKVKILDSQILEKTLLRYYYGLLLIIKGNSKGFKYIKKSLGYLLFVNDRNIYVLSKKFYYKILKLYNIKI